MCIFSEIVLITKKIPIALFSRGDRRRKYESLWRKTRLTVHFDMYSENCMAVKKCN